MSKHLTLAQNCQVAKTVYMNNSEKKLGNVESLLQLIPVTDVRNYIFLLFSEFNSEPFTRLPGYPSVYRVQVLVPLDLNSTKKDQRSLSLFSVLRFERFYEG